MVVASGTQVSGSVLVSAYLGPILGLVGITRPVQQAALLAGLNMYGLAVLAFVATFIEKFGRRPVWLWSIGLQTICFAIFTALSGAFAAKKTPSIGVAVMPFIYLFFGFYVACWSTVAHVSPSTSSSKSITVTYNQYVNPIALAKIAWKYYFLFLALQICYFIYAYFFFLETKGLTMEEVGQVYDGKQRVEEIRAGGHQREKYEEAQMETEPILVSPSPLIILDFHLSHLTSPTYRSPRGSSSFTGNMLRALLTHAFTLTLTLTLSLLSLPLTSALPQITRTGKYLYDPSGTRFAIKGVAYQPEGQLEASSEANDANGGFPEPSSFTDPLSSPTNCTRDVPHLRQLGVNALRVYSVNSSLDHDECMGMLSSAGIYVLLDVSLPLNGSIDRSVPAWTTALLNEYTRTINAFLKYDNVLAFNIGNEVINLPSNTNAAPFVKAAARDIKAYLKSVNSSALVGYSAVDGEPDFRNTLAQYITCGDEAVSVDIYGLNNYEWCGNETLRTSNWDEITAGFSSVPVATYMSEFGCITSPPRIWNEVQALYTSPVSDVFSGGVAFSYFPTSDGFGMVSFSADGTTVTTSDDFTRLSSQFNATGLPTSPAKSSVSSTTITCPAQNATLLASITLPPTPDESVCNCVNSNALACRARPFTADEPLFLGELTDYACSLLGSSGSGASCNAISGNGSAGVYGSLSMCSPAIKLSYAMSAYYEFNPVDSSCDFSGNATLSSSRPNTAQDASAAAASCLNAVPSGGVFTPTAQSAIASATATPSGAAALKSGAASSAPSSAAAALRIDLGRWTPLVVGVVGAVIGGEWVLV